MEKSLKVLFIGDIVGKLGRQAVREIVPGLRKKRALDLVIANVENLAHGKGVTKKTFKEISGCGIDVYTSGNHIWHSDEVIPLLEDEKTQLLRPANFPKKAPGRGMCIISVKKQDVAVINLIGRVFMRADYDDPFACFDHLIASLKKDTVQVIVDFHAEATSEKKAFGWYAHGRAALVCGTHTHVPTADAEIIGDHHMGYVTDVGMVGAQDSVLGVQKETIIEGFLTQRPVKHTMVKTGKAVFNSIYAEIKNNHTVRIERVDVVT